jgi:hypothetical protein
MIDVVIPLGKGSRNGDLELRYCLRAIQKYLKNYRYVVIVGELPSFLTGVLHIPFVDSDQKETNIMRKVLAACNTPEITDDFIFFNDDHFLLRRIDAQSYPYFHRGNLSNAVHKYPVSNIYRQSIQNTANALRFKGFNDLHFDIHTPIIYNKAKFRDVVPMYNWDTYGSLVVKSTYCNTLRIAGELMKDCKIDQPLTHHQITERIDGRHVFSIGDNGLNNEMRAFLHNLYPKKSKYEK